MHDTIILLIDQGVAREALALGLNMSRVAEAAIAEAARLERKRLRRVQYRAALEACARQAAWDGLAPTQDRGF